MLESQIWPRRGSQLREEQAHIRCPQCAIIEACCEDVPVQHSDY